MEKETALVRYAPFTLLDPAIVPPLAREKLATLNDLRRSATLEVWKQAGIGVWSGIAACGAAVISTKFWSFHGIGFLVIGLALCLLMNIKMFRAWRGWKMTREAADRLVRETRGQAGEEAEDERAAVRLLQEWNRMASVWNEADAIARSTDVDEEYRRMIVIAWRRIAKARTVVENAVHRLRERSYVTADPDAPLTPLRGRSFGRKWLPMP